MQTHRDDDAKLSAGMAELFQRAADMTKRRENEITAGKPGEAPLREYEASGMTVRKMPDDPACLRVSIGELLIPEHEGAYLVFRGDVDKVRALLQRALSALRTA